MPFRTCSVERGVRLRLGRRYRPAEAVETALRGAGFVVERQEAEDGGLADIFPDMGQGWAEWIIAAAGGAQMVLQLAYFDRNREPVVMEIGPVLAATNSGYDLRFAAETT